MKYFVTLFICLFLTLSAYAEETPKEFKSLQDRPDAVHQLRELKNCTITYYNIGVYANVGGSIVELIKGDPETREKMRMIFNRADAQHKVLQKKLDTLVEYLLKGGYHPLEISIVLDDAQNTMLGIITQMMTDIMEDPSRTNNMLLIMMEGTNKCDEEFLN